MEDWLLSLKHVGDSAIASETGRSWGGVWAVLYYLKELAVAPSVPILPLCSLNAIDLLNILLFRFLIASASVRFSNNTTFGLKSSFLFHI